MPTTESVRVRILKTPPANDGDSAHHLEIRQTDEGGSEEWVLIENGGAPVAQADRDAAYTAIAARANFLINTV